MVDIRSPRVPLTVQLPAELVAELETLAREKKTTVDDVVMEACLDYTEPYGWERSYKEWRRRHPDEPLSELGIDGGDLNPGQPKEGSM